MMGRRLLRFAFGTSLARAISQRSGKWLSVAGGLVVLRVLTRRRDRRPAESQKNPAT